MMMNYSLSTDWKAEEGYMAPFNFSFFENDRLASDLKGASVKLCRISEANFNLHILYFNNTSYGLL